VVYIQPGKPQQNGFVEHFNGSFRREFLNAYLFGTLTQVRDMAWVWMLDYNDERPHESLGDLPPAVSGPFPGSKMDFTKSPEALFSGDRSKWRFYLKRPKPVIHLAAGLTNVQMYKRLSYDGMGLIYSLYLKSAPCTGPFHRVRALNQRYKINFRADRSFIGVIMAISLTINENKFKVDADPDTPLLWVLRDHLGLTGTKFGCGIGQCGACTVHLNGMPTRSCSIPAGAVTSMDISTIEALSPDGSHPLQKAWLTLNVPQCGYCQAGMLMAAAALLKEKPHPTDDDIDTAITNICRCGTYPRVRAAIHQAADELTYKA
jgi:isoquinoline 1-oxidoreductase alpha subunit